MKMNCTKREFGYSFLKCLGWFVGGFFLMLGLINVLMWIFGKTVAIWIAWIIIILGWIGVIACSTAQTEGLSKEHAEELRRETTDPLG